MSHPIDFIDLTIDSPANKALRLQRFASKQQSQHGDSPIYIPSDRSDGPCNVKSTEIIDLSNVPENTKIHHKSDYEQRRSVLYCPICYDELSSDRLPMSTACGHIFCKICLTKAISTSKQCPICNRPAKLRLCRRIYF